MLTVISFVNDNSSPLATVVFVFSIVVVVNTVVCGFDVTSILVVLSTDWIVVVVAAVLPIPHVSLSSFPVVTLSIMN